MESMKQTMKKQKVPHPIKGQAMKNIGPKTKAGPHPGPQKSMTKKGRRG